MQKCTMSSAEDTPPQTPSTSPAESACPQCGVIDPPVVGPGSGPHTASLRCGHCQHFRCWLSTKTPAERQQARQQAMAARPPTAAQLAYLVSLGDQDASPESAWDASQRIDALQRGEGA
jgi:hypothetical protein